MGACGGEAGGRGSSGRLSGEAGDVQIFDHNEKELFQSRSLVRVWPFVWQGDLGKSENCLHQRDSAQLSGGGLQPVAGPPVHAREALNDLADPVLLHGSGGDIMRCLRRQVCQGDTSVQGSGAHRSEGKHPHWRRGGGGRYYAPRGGSQRRRTTA